MMSEGRMKRFYSLFDGKKPVIGMIHLLPLPGSPQYKNSMKEIENAALHDLYALENGGANAAIIENFGDIPYTTQVSTATFASMCTIATKIAERASIPLGINIQYNCVEYEWALACAIGAKFIRVEAFVENRAGAHGVVYATAAELMRLKAFHPSETMIFADINAKHTTSLTNQPISLSVKEAIECGADALILTGIRTGVNPSIEDLVEVKEIASDTPILLGSGINISNASKYYESADGAIIGSSLKEDGNVFKRIDETRVKDFIKAVGSCQNHGKSES